MTTPTTAAGNTPGRPASRIVLSRVQLDAIDRATVQRARQILADAKTVDFTDTIAICRALGRLEAITGAVLDVLDRAEDGAR